MKIDVGDITIHGPELLAVHSRNDMIMYGRDDRVVEATVKIYDDFNEATMDVKVYGSNWREMGEHVDAIREYMRLATLRLLQSAKDKQPEKEC